MKFLYPLAKRFIAGYDFDSAKGPIKKLMDEGYEVSVDYLGELSETCDDCLKARGQYLEIVNFYKDKKINLSIKPTQLGLSISQSMAYNFVCDIAEEALKHGHTIRLDMEGSAVTQKTIDLCLKVKKLLPNVGVAVQSNLRETINDVDRLINDGISVRLVKGAYKEDKSIAYQNEDEIRESFFNLARRFSGQKPNKLAIGTHDEELINKILEFMPDSHGFDYELLYGIRRDLQKNLKNMGLTVRIYVPFGRDWFPYAARRLKEKKALKFVLRNIFRG